MGDDDETWTQEILEDWILGCNVEGQMAYNEIGKEIVILFRQVMKLQNFLFVFAWIISFYLISNDLSTDKALWVYLAIFFIDFEELHI